MSSGLNERQQRIVDELKYKGEVKISDLKERFEVTDMTVRRDLEKLEKIGELKRTFGGAILTSKDVALRERSVVRMAEKERIGRKAALLVAPGDSIFIDGGSTTLQVARNLPEHSKITVVTNAINVAAELSERKIPTIVIGGVLIETTNSMVGQVAIESLSRMAFDKAFLGGTGVDPIHGLSNSNMHEAEIKRLAIRKAKEAYVVMDHSKFGASMLFSFATLSDIHAIITDQVPDESLDMACQAADTSVILA
ncbi:DeoR/GlpR family DNA-binding transcription regulator [Cohnella lupini]|uniref:DeoR family transcriptional regulator n=1 Tax=Cohnella lupini TaxID=1294267 RepID=A0A3D9I644_9BACL|nr:DeoR/GlpR family DNA-binding transcription regulator [Cohnella lupini]RED57243.1 DeoR family transcriptional regulator [Cohnella lupini]